MRSTADGRTPFTHQFLPGLVLILFLIGGGSALWDYFRVSAITRDLAMREASGLIYQFEQEVKSAAQGEQTARAYLEDHLFGVAWMVQRLLETPPSRRIDWDEVAIEAGVLDIDMYDAAGRRLAGTSQHTTLAKPRLDSLLANLAWDPVGEATLGFIVPDSGETALYAVAVGSENGGAIVTAIQASDLLAWRDQIGLGAILQNLSGHPEVSWAVLSGPDGILAATRNLPGWIGGPGDSFDRESVPTDSIQARFTVTPEGKPVFEAATHLAGVEGVLLRLAVHADELKNIRRRSLVALSVRTALFMLLGGLLLVLLVLRQNHRLLTSETERIRREVERLEADRTASERLEAMGKLAGGVAHEIRNPLNTVGMVAQRLEAEYDPGEGGEEFRELVKTMRSETARIGKIVQDFLTFARPPKANKVRDNLGDTLEQVAALFRPMAEGDGIIFEQELAPVPPFAFDREQVGQAVQNLLRNALEAVPREGGRITLAARREGGYAVIEVADNGPGIPAEERVRIFHLYYTTKAEGTGVGLSLVHRIADVHEGRVEVADRETGGAILRLYLKREEG